MTTFAVRARVKDGVTEAQAVDRVNRYFKSNAGRLNSEYGYEIELDPFARYIAGDLQRPLWLLWGAALLLLFTGCANIAGLLLARVIQPPQGNRHPDFRRRDVAADRPPAPARKPAARRVRRGGRTRDSRRRGLAADALATPRRSNADPGFAKWTVALLWIRPGAIERLTLRLRARDSASAPKPVFRVGAQPAQMVPGSVRHSRSRRSVRPDRDDLSPAAQPLVGRANSGRLRPT